MGTHRQNDTARLKKAFRLAVSSPHYFGYAFKLLFGCITRDGRQKFARHLRGLTLPSRRCVEYPTWLAANLRDRAERYPAVAAPGMFSFLTSVYETKGRYIRELYESVKSQTVGEFEWVLLDNGSTKADTLAAIEEVRRDPRVVYSRVEDNLGILGGIAHCLQRATGRYIVPLDSDDLLTPDALAILRQHIAESREPPLLYTDEDKCRETPVPFEAYHKPDWDPVLFWNSCYIAHLCAIRRDLALELGVYSDDMARGCHDWDSFLRFWGAGHNALHVPEVTYSWRQHPQSCAGNIFSKSYIHESHEHVLTRHLEATVGRERFELVASPLFPDTPDWWVRRLRVAPWRLTAVFVARSGAEIPAWLREHPLVERTVSIAAADLADLESALAPLQLRAEDLVAVVYEGCEPVGDEWAWEAMGLCERFPDTAVIGGRLLDHHGNLWSAGEVVGFEGIVGTPDRGRHALDPGYFAWLRKQRSVSSVHAAFCIVRAGFLNEFAAERLPASVAMLGAWLGAFARERGRRVVCSPFVEARVPGDAPPSEAVGTVEAGRFLRRFPDFLVEDRYYSRHLGLEHGSAFTAVGDDERARSLANLLTRLVPDRELAAELGRMRQAGQRPRQVVA